MKRAKPGLEPLDEEPFVRVTEPTSGRQGRHHGVCGPILIVGLLILTVLVVFAIGIPLSKSSRDTGIAITLEERLAVVKDVLQRTPLIDGHNDLPWHMRIAVGQDFRSLDLLGDLREQLPPNANAGSHTDIPRLRQGMVGAQFWSVFTGCQFQYRDAVEGALEQIDMVKVMVSRYADDLQLVKSVDELVAAHAAGKIASLIGVEGGHMIAENAAVLRQLYELGARYLTLTWNCNTVWVDCNNPEGDEQTPMNNGLSDWGKLLMHEMNRLGMFIDLSHVSPATMADALNATMAPVIFSHSSAHALCPHRRNVPDDILRKMPENGGVVMVNFATFFINCTSDNVYETGMADRNASLEQVADHIEHIRGIAGIDHVGIGSDFDGIPKAPDGLEDASKLPYLLAELLGRGWTEEEVAKVAGANLLRAFRAVEQIRDELKHEPSMSETLDQQLLPDTSCQTLNWDI